MDPTAGKLWYRIGEVAQLTGLRPSVLRFWETEFPQLSPRKSRTGQRLYSQADIVLVRDLQQLLHRERLTIDGARRRLKQQVRSQQVAAEVDQADVQRADPLLQEVLVELRELRRLLDSGS